MANSGDQVLRYSPGVRPLWMCDEAVPGPADVPACAECGGQREFEFQVMPQLLNLLGLDGGRGAADASVDWGVLAVFTCKKSCGIGDGYAKEFLFRQFPSSK